MTLLDTIATFTLAAALTAIYIGLRKDRDTMENGLVLLVLWLVVVVSFQSGAWWRRQGTLEKYQLVPLKPCEK